MEALLAKLVDKAVQHSARRVWNGFCCAFFALLLHYTVVNVLPDDDWAFILKCLFAVVAAGGGLAMVLGALFPILPPRATP